MLLSQTRGPCCRSCSPLYWVLSRNYMKKYFFCESTACCAERQACLGPAKYLDPATAAAADQPAAAGECSSFDSLSNAVQRSSSPWFSGLAQELLVHVMRHVAQLPRLGPCSLMCNSWCSAAATSTVNSGRNVLCGGDYEYTEEASARGLVSSSAQVHRSAMAGCSWTSNDSAYMGACYWGNNCSACWLRLLQLPCVQLQRLQGLICHNVQLQELQPGDSSSHTNAGMQQTSSRQLAVLPAAAFSFWHWQLHICGCSKPTVVAVQPSIFFISVQPDQHDCPRP
ncbi:hypothetical protein COO60DRAFT_351461 [Scenedesmus sp. NREL 46B-D3]|nr:hypothetical protein COO60DRAFT_351461 [Scenedesmus sp. NREL 46B-D3]